MENLYRVSFDLDLTDNQRYITIPKKVYQRLHPNFISKKISFLFLKGYALLFPANVTQYLISNYNELKIFDTSGKAISNLDELKFYSMKELIAEAKKLKISFEGLSKFELKLQIQLAKQTKKRKSA